MRSRLVDPRAVLLPLLTIILAGCANLPFVSPPSQPYDATAAREQYRGMLRDQAVSHGTRADEPERAGLNLVEGDRYAHQGDLPRAVVSYFRAARLAPESIEPRLRIAHLEIRANPQRAERAFRGLLAESAEEPAVWFGLGLACLAQSKLAEAAQALERALSLDSDFAAAHSVLGSVYDRMGRRAEGRVHLGRALEIEPDDVTALNNLAVSHLIADEPDRAEPLLRSALQLSPDDRTISNNLGLSVGLQERYDDALAIFRRTVDEQAAQNNLAYVYYLNGRPEEAVALYERALLAGGEHTIPVLENLRRARLALEARAEGAPAVRP
jgi:Flp pilus assembly protein TadD